MNPNPTLSLRCHPDTPCGFLNGIHVQVAREGHSLHLCYTLSGDMARLCLPAPAMPGPADELWRHTCCEAFVALEGEAYREFNFSPSGQWAVYDFSAYRQRVEKQPADDVPAIALSQQAGSVVLNVAIPAALLPQGEWQLGLTAVVEGVNGEMAYWALAHAPGKPDFHRRENFTLRLKPRNLS